MIQKLAFIIAALDTTTPARGRFLSEDRLELKGGDVDLYRYVGNSPLGFIDPDGLGKPPADPSGLAHKNISFVQLELARVIGAPESVGVQAIGQGDLRLDGAADPPI